MAVKPDSDPGKWMYHAHTRVKHTLLERYIGAWGKIMGSERAWRSRRRLVLIDGFAGRGEHCDPTTLEPLPESGSPVVMMRVSQNLLMRRNASEVVCAFIENDRANHARLGEIVEASRARYPDVQALAPFLGRFEDRIERVIRDTRPAYGASFFFIDPFGFSDIPMETMQRILAIPRAEMFITYIYRDANRFFGFEGRREAYERLYGAAYHEIPKDPHERREFYISQLSRERDSYPSTFRNCADARLETVYYLIHICQHPRGRRLMKEIMFRQSSSGQGGEFAYLGPQDYLRNQGRLFEEETPETLAAMLIERLRGQTLDFSTVQDTTCMDTLLVQSHYRTALRRLEHDGQVRIDRIQSKKTGIADRDRITFI